MGSDLQLTTLHKLTKLNDQCTIVMSKVRVKKCKEMIKLNNVNLNE